MLIPVSAVQTPGAFGSLWSTELWFRNDSDSVVGVFPLAIADAGSPPIAWTTFLPIGAGRPGMFIYVDKRGGRDVQLDLRLFNRADTKSSWGTKLPTVRDEGFRTGTIHLIRVPTGAGYRAALRVYGLPEYGVEDQVITVRVISDPATLLASTVLEFARDDWRPRYAQILSLSDLLPEASESEPVTIAVESSDPAARLWAFVSVTANATQHVSVITPD